MIEKILQRVVYPANFALIKRYVVGNKLLFHVWNTVIRFVSFVVMRSCAPNSDVYELAVYRQNSRISYG